MNTNMNTWIRQSHRWLSVAFTLSVIANIACMFLKEQAQWIGFAALLPLLPLMFSGLYLLVQPWLKKSHSSTQSQLEATTDGAV